MTLPASGQISMGQINTELGYSATAMVSLNDAAVRTLLGLPSGQIDMNTAHGKSNVTTSRPTASTWSGTATYGTHSNDASAYDVEATPTTSASIGATAKPRTAPGLSTSQMIYSGFSGSGALSGTLKVYLDSSTVDSFSIDSANEAQSSVQVDYCTNWNGSTGTWTSLGGVTGGIGGDFNHATPLQVAVSVANRTTLAVRVTCTGQGVGTTINSYASANASASVYDIRV